MLADKANLAAQTKEERAEIEAAIAELRQERQKQVAQKRDTVKKQLSQGGTKLQQQRAARLQMVGLSNGGSGAAYTSLCTGWHMLTFSAHVDFMMHTCNSTMHMLTAGSGRVRAACEGGG